MTKPQVFNEEPTAKEKVASEGEEDEPEESRDNHAPYNLRHHEHITYWHKNDRDSKYNIRAIPPIVPPKPATGSEESAEEAVEKTHPGASEVADDKTKTVSSNQLANGPSSRGKASEAETTTEEMRKKADQEKEGSADVEIQKRDGVSSKYNLRNHDSSLDRHLLGGANCSPIKVRYKAKPVPTSASLEPATGREKSAERAVRKADHIESGGTGGSPESLPPHTRKHRIAASEIPNRRRRTPKRQQHEASTNHRNNCRLSAGKSSRISLAAMVENDVRAYKELHKNDPPAPSSSSHATLEHRMSHPAPRNSEMLLRSNTNNLLKMFPDAKEIFQPTVFYRPHRKEMRRIINQLNRGPKLPPPPNVEVKEETGTVKERGAPAVPPKSRRPKTSKPVLKPRVAPWKQTRKRSHPPEEPKRPRKRAKSTIPIRLVEHVAVNRGRGRPKKDCGPHVKTEEHPKKGRRRPQKDTGEPEAAEESPKKKACFKVPQISQVKLKELYDHFANIPGLTERERFEWLNGAIMAEMDFTSLAEYKQRYLRIYKLYKSAALEYTKDVWFAERGKEFTMAENRLQMNPNRAMRAASHPPSFQNWDMGASGEFLNLSFNDYDQANPWVSFPTPSGASPVQPIASPYLNGFCSVGNNLMYDILPAIDHGEMYDNETMETFQPILEDPATISLYDIMASKFNNSAPSTLSEVSEESARTNLSGAFCDIGVDPDLLDQELSTEFPDFLSSPEPSEELQKRAGRHNGDSGFNYRHIQPCQFEDGQIDGYVQQQTAEAQESRCPGKPTMRDYLFPGLLPQSLGEATTAVRSSDSPNHFGGQSDPATSDHRAETHPVMDNNGSTQEEEYISRLASVLENLFPYNAAPPATTQNSDAERSLDTAHSPAPILSVAIDESDTASLALSDEVSSEDLISLIEASSPTFDDIMEESMAEESSIADSLLQERASSLHISDESSATEATTLVEKASKSQASKPALLADVLKDHSYSSTFEAPTPARHSVYEKFFAEESPKGSAVEELQETSQAEAPSTSLMSDTATLALPAEVSSEDSSPSLFEDPSPTRDDLMEESTAEESVIAASLPREMAFSLQVPQETSASEATTLVKTASEIEDGIISLSVQNEAEGEIMKTSQAEVPPIAPILSADIEESDTATFALSDEVSSEGSSTTSHFDAPPIPGYHLMEESSANSPSVDSAPVPGETATEVTTLKASEMENVTVPSPVDTQDAEMEASEEDVPSAAIEESEASNIALLPYVLKDHPHASLLESPLPVEDNLMDEPLAEESCTGDCVMKEDSSPQVTPTEKAIASEVTKTLEKASERKETAQEFRYWQTLIEETRALLGLGKEDSDDEAKAQNVMDLYNGRIVKVVEQSEKEMNKIAEEEERFSEFSKMIWNAK